MVHEPWVWNLKFQITHYTPIMQNSKSTNSLTLTHWNLNPKTKYFILDKKQDNWRRTAATFLAPAVRAPALAALLLSSSLLSALLLKCKVQTIFNQYKTSCKFKTMTLSTCKHLLLEVNQEKLQIKTKRSCVRVFFRDRVWACFSLKGGHAWGGWSFP